MNPPEESAPKSKSYSFTFSAAARQTKCIQMQCSSDHAARLTADIALVAGGYARVEVWDGARFVFASDDRG